MSNARIQQGDADEAAVGMEVRRIVLPFLLEGTLATLFGLVAGLKQVLVQTKTRPIPLRDSAGFSPDFPRHQTHDSNFSDAEQYKA